LKLFVAVRPWQAFASFELLSLRKAVLGVRRLAAAFHPSMDYIYCHEILISYEEERCCCWHLTVHRSGIQKSLHLSVLERDFDVSPDQVSLGIAAPGGGCVFAFALDCFHWILHGGRQYLPVRQTQLYFDVEGFLADGR
jgi:hypothetical protein